MEAALLSIIRWMDRENVGFVHWGQLLSHKKERNLPCTAPRMHLEGITLSEISQTEEDKDYDITYMWN